MRVLSLVLVFLVIPPFLLSGASAEKPGDATGFADDIDPTGQQLNEFVGVTVDGTRVSTKDMLGKVLLITLWGINCGSCLEEMVVLEGLYRELKDDGFEIWAVNAEQRDKDGIKESLAGKGISVTYPLLVDEEMTITRLFTSWFIPVTVIVDRRGMVQYYKIGFNKTDSGKVGGIVGELLKK